MRTKIKLLIILTLATFAANAQYSPFSFGLKAAPQINWMKPNSDFIQGNGSKIGFSWGFVAEKNFSENYSINSGFNMLFNGGKLKITNSVDGAVTTTNRNYFLKYIEIPVTLKMRTNSINGIRYFGRIGVGSAFKIGSKSTDEVTIAGGATTTNLKKAYDKISFVRESLIIGLGGEYELNEGPKLGLELTFNNGFTNVLTEKGQKANPNSLELAFSIIF